MALYEMELQTKDEIYIGSIPFYELQGEFRMNEPDQIRFKTSSVDLLNYVDPPSGFKAGYTEVVLWRDGVNIFTGPIWNISVTSEQRALTVDAQDISSYLKQRIVSKDTKFTKKRYSYGAWKLIQDMQAESYGNYGITLGQDAATNPTGSYSYTRKSGTYIYDAITKLSSGTNGFDWEIDPARRLMMYYPRIQTVSDIRLEYGENSGNIKRYSMHDIGRYVANEIFTRSGKTIVSTTYTDAASMAVFGRRQFVPSDSALKSKAKANAYSQQQLSLRKAPRLIPQVTVDPLLVNPFEGDIGYGQLVDLKVDDGWVQFDGTMRCSGFQVTVGKHGNEAFTLYINDTREIEDVIV